MDKFEYKNLEAGNIAELLLDMRYLRGQYVFYSLAEKCLAQAGSLAVFLSYSIQASFDRVDIDRIYRCVTLINGSIVDQIYTADELQAIFKKIS